jgi:diguanylate cyclase (GGDEF)-like protein
MSMETGRPPAQGDTVPSGRATPGRRAQEIVARGAARLSDGQDHAATLQGIAAAARSALGADRATCYAYDVEAQVVSAVYTTEDDPARRRFLEKTVGLGPARLPIWRLQLAQPDPLLVVDDVSRDPVVPPALAERLGAGAFVGVRLEHLSVRDAEAPALLGTLFCSYSRPRRFTDAERQAARGLANLAALALANARLQAQTARNLEENRVLTAEQGALRRIATQVAAEADPEEIFARVAEEVAALLGVECGLVARYESTRAVVVGWWGEGGPGIGAAYPLAGPTALAQVARSGLVARVDDDAPHADDPMGSVATSGGYRSGVAAPVRVGGRVWGALLAATGQETPIEAGAEARLRRFAELIGLAIANTESRTRLAAQAASDPLTGLANHRSFFERLHADVERARRHGRALGLVLLDLDHFKAVNDTHGHQAGDRVLVEVAERLAPLARAEDTLARVGGEEFAWLLPESSAEECLAAAERARRAIAGTPFLGVGRVTMSAGVAELRTGGNELFRAADAALYWAKDQGRDSCAVSTPELDAAFAARTTGAGSHLASGVDRLLALVHEQLGLALTVVGEFRRDVCVIRHLAGDADAFGVRPGFQIPLERTYCHRMTQGRLPHLIRDARREARVRDLRLTTAAGIGAYVGVPIPLPGGGVYGSLSCMSPSPEPALGASDVRLLKIVAGLIGEELEREELLGQARHRVRESILRMLEGDGLSVVLQPIVELSGGRVVAAEALSRFAAEPRRSPDAWFADAAAVGLGVELELAAARAALASVDTLPPGVRLSLNVSPAALCSPALADALAAAPGSRLALELTEHAPVEDYEALSRALAGLRARGVKLMIDDAGAGFASFRHVLGLEPDVIKLDLSLTRDIHRDPVRRALAASLVAFAREIGADIVAEGIETQEELDALLGLGITLGQGYYIARPGPDPVRPRLPLAAAAPTAP